MLEKQITWLKTELKTGGKWMNEDCLGLKGEKERETVCSRSWCKSQMKKQVDVEEDEEEENEEESKKDYNLKPLGYSLLDSKSNSWPTCFTCDDRGFSLLPDSFSLMNVMHECFDAGLGLPFIILQRISSSWSTSSYSLLKQMKMDHQVGHQERLSWRSSQASLSGAGWGKNDFLEESRDWKEREDWQRKKKIVYEKEESDQTPFDQKSFSL